MDKSGRQVLFETATGGEIHSVNGDGTALALLTHGIDPSWSPDGKQVLFPSNRNGKCEFFVVNPEGTHLAQVLTNVTDKIALDFAYQNERMMDWTSAPALAP